MIGFFPDPYPDELLYSTCARYQERALYRNKTIVGKELFGVRHGSASLHFPSRIEHLIANLPPNHHYTADDLIDRHTSLPYFTPFMSAERVQQIRKDMKQYASYVASRTGLTGSIISFPLWLRFCPLCTRNDIETFGESYWHRLHQMPGVEVCPTHLVWLEECRDTQTPHKGYISAESAIDITKAVGRHVDISNPGHRALIQISHDASWLLNQQALIPGGQKLLDCYLELTCEQGLATKSGYMRREKFRELVLKKYSPEILQALQPGMRTGGELAWLVQLRTNLVLGKTSHTLQHLLLIQALGYTAEEFFRRCANITQRGADGDFKPFGDGPWPCLNPASDHFGEHFVLECQRRFTREWNRRPLGIFACACGFAYSRVGPDNSPEDRVKIDRIRAYGHIWDSKLRTLWGDRSLGIKKITSMLGFANPSALKRQAVRLGLPFPRVGPGYAATQASAEFLSKHYIDDEIAIEKLNDYRTKWLNGIELNPEVKSIRILIRNKELAIIYRKLLKSDREWLGTHRPQIDRKRSSSLAATKRNQELWEKRDGKTATAIENAIGRLRNREGYPLELNLATICKEANIRTLYSYQLLKLPVTSKVLVENSETRIELIVRRIQWAAGHFKERKIIPSLTKLMNLARVNQQYRKRAEVKEAARQALREIASFITTV